MKNIFPILLSIFLLTSCSETKTSNNNEGTTETPETYSQEVNGIKVYEAEIAAEYPEAILTHNDIDNLPEGTDSIDFNFMVENYDLATSTPGQEERNCAVSGKGQHIHFILNNQPYKAKYTNSFCESVSEGNNVLLAFLSRSYHESIKNGTAAVITQFNVGDALDTAYIEDIDTGEFTMEVEEHKTDLSAPHLFYSRPKGSYKLSEANRFLLDFYLLNSELSPEGNKVRATINGNEFILSAWKPYFIEGLGVGEHTVRIELIDKDGNLIQGPFNDSGERAFTVTEA